MLKTPETMHGIVNRVTDSVFAYQGWPSVCRDENGVLYAVASSFRTEHVCPFGKTAMYVSRNGGRTWTPPVVINDTYLDDRDAGIVYMGHGRMLVTWFCHPAEVYETQYYNPIKNSAQPSEAGPSLGMLASYRHLPADRLQGGSFVRVSEDYGVTWSETIRLPVSAPHGPSVLADGTLMYLGKELYSSTCDTPEEPGVVAAYASTDGGYTWERRGTCQKPDDLSWDHFHEPHVIGLDGGRLLGAIRAQGQGVAHGFTVYTTVSDDGGCTWSPWRCVGVSGSPPHLMKHPSGAVVMSVGRREPLFGERALVSFDGGETWPDEYVIDDRAADGDLGYPASVTLDDGTILTVYYQKWPGDGKCSILYTKWRLEG